MQNTNKNTKRSLNYLNTHMQFPTYDVFFHLHNSKRRLQRKRPTSENRGVPVRTARRHRTRSSCVIPKGSLGGWPETENQSLKSSYSYLLYHKFVFVLLHSFQNLWWYKNNIGSNGDILDSYLQDWSQSENSRMSLQTVPLRIYLRKTQILKSLNEWLSKTQLKLTFMYLVTIDTNNTIDEAHPKMSHTKLFYRT